MNTNFPNLPPEPRSWRNRKHPHKRRPVKKHRTRQRGDAVCNRPRRGPQADERAEYSTGGK